ncbi:YcaO-like family protein [Streptomyces sp. WMMC940]|uniref:YcaO-like family protein n=1 Tax=Streptomyces sp. WMMC940 TaxID=3015153 RepID=UPI0022B5E97C|nr:YcaO-like family protein [Streptomyces sp. WMMC940]MCZ7456293.1 YcaO-like family protein [Streptomyces sp. WMMC940]
MTAVLDFAAPPHRWSAVWQGTHRTVPPEETWQRLQPLLGTVGITRVADVTLLDDIGLPVWQAIRPNAMSLSVSQGKGVTHELARVSAAMESFELHCAEEPALETAVASPARLATELTYDWAELPLLGGHALRSGTRIRWCPVEDLTARTGTWAPLESVAVDLRMRSSWAPPTVQTSSNGLAGGNNLTEATLHGLLEVVERHSLAVTARSGGPWKSAVRAEPDGSGTASAVLERLLWAGAVVEIADVTCDLRVPTFAARVWSPSVPWWFSGSGTHPDADVALSRALTEAAQSRLTAVAGARDDIGVFHYDFADTAGTSAPRPGDGGAAVCRVADLTRTHGTASTGPRDLDADLANLLDVAAHHGITVLRADLTVPAYGIPVVHVVAPGLTFDTGAWA